MTTITTRSGKGSPLTNNEVDANFTNLNSDKAELSGADFTGDISIDGVLDFVATSGGFPTTGLVLYSNNYLYQRGGSNGIIFSNASGTNEIARFTASTATFNEDSNDQDFRVESNNQTHALFVDAGNDTVNINRSSGPASLNVQADSGADGIAIYGRSSDEISQITNYNSTGSGLSQLQTRTQYTELKTLTDVPLYFSPNNALKLKVSTSETVVNENSADHDFRVESDSNANMLFVDAGLNRVGLLTNTPSDTLDVRSGGIRLYDNTDGNGGVISFGSSAGYQTLGGGSGSDNMNYRTYGSHVFKTTTGPSSTTDGTERMSIGTGVVINETGADADFRVESNNNANMIFVDAGNDHVNIGTSTDYGGSLNVNKKLVVRALDGESANDYVASFQNQEATNSQSFGLSIAAGSTSSDIALNVVDHDASNVLLRVLGNGATNIGGAVTLDSSLTTGGNFLAESSATLNSTIRATGNNTRAIGNYQAHDSSGNDVNMVMGVFGDANRAEVSTNTNHTLRLYVNNTPSKYLEIATTGQVFTSHGMIVNEDSNDSDFRVESNNQANMLVVDASADKVGIGGSAGDTTLTVRGSNNSAGDLYTAVGAGNVPGIVVQNAGTTDNNSAAVFFKNDAAVVASVGARFVSHSTEETELRFSTTNSSGTTRERVTISGEGNVGIGTTDGDVTSDGNASRTYVGIIGSGNRGRLNIGSTAANGADGGAISFVNGANELGALYNDANSGSQTVGTMYLTSTGALDVRATGGAVFNESSVDADFRVESNSNFAAFFVDAGNSRVGINQDVPTEALDIVGNVKVGSLLKVEDIIAKSSTGLNLQTDEGTKRIIVEDSGGVIVNETSADCDFRVESNNNAYMLRVDGGNDRVAIGTNAPQETLEVRGGSTSAIRVSGGSNTAHRIQIGYDNTDGPYVRAGSSGVTKLQFYVDSTTLAAEIASNGDFYTNDGTVHSLSDIRVKTDVEDLADGLDLVKQLRPRTFKYTEDSEFYSESTKDEVRYGFVANEVEAVAPQYTDTGKGKIGGVEVDDLKSLSTTKMIPMLVKAIQEQSEIIDDLRARVAQLESN